MGSCLSILDTFQELNKGYKHEGKYVNMGEHRKCSYNKHGFDDKYKLDVKEIVPIGKPVPRQKSPNGSTKITPMPVELRGITLRQLRAIIANVERRCKKEEWKDWNGNLLTPETVTLHDINKYIIKPYTKESESSFVETLPSTAGEQPPRFFVSHTWGETFFHTMDCIEQMVKDFKNNVKANDDKRGGGMTEDTPIWICAFANNQHDLDNAITADPSESGFAKAMEVANYRTLSILDKDGEVFTRIWCIFELHLTLIKVQEKKEKGGDDVEWDGLWAVYTAHEHIYEGEEDDDEENRKAVGIVAGGTTCEGGLAYTTAIRERHFPMDRILKSVNTTIQTANASIPHDKRHILNYISDNVNGIDAEPLQEHEKYEALNDAVRGAFASTIAVLQSACGGGDDEWQRVLRTMSKSIKKDPMNFTFGAGDGWDDLSPERAAEMISHLPSSIEELYIESAPYGSPFMDGLIDWIEKKSTNLESLAIANPMCVGGSNVNDGRDAGIRLSKALAAKNTIEILVLIGTDLMGSRNVDDWSKAFHKMTSLKQLVCVGMSGFIKDVDESTFDEKTSTVEYEYPDMTKQRIYWNNKTFPDATMKEEDVQKLKEATHATEVTIVGM